MTGFLNSDLCKLIAEYQQPINKWLVRYGIISTSYNEGGKIDLITKSFSSKKKACDYLSDLIETDTIDWEAISYRCDYCEVFMNNSKQECKYKGNCICEYCVRIPPKSESELIRIKIKEEVRNNYKLLSKFVNDVISQKQFGFIENEGNSDIGIKADIVKLEY